jgi:hypothetical protein
MPNSFVKSTRGDHLELKK